MSIKKCRIGSEDKNLDYAFGKATGSAHNVKDPMQ